METNITDSFEYHAERAKQNFQTYLSTLLELHSYIQQKISAASSAGKTGIWLDREEAKVIQGNILDTVTNLSGSYTTINNTNKLLSTNNKAYQVLFKDDITRSISEFKRGAIDKDQFASRVNSFISVRKPSLAA